MRFAQWLNEELGHSLTPPNIPRVTNGWVGNELRTDAGRYARARSGESEDRYNNFKTVVELPVPRMEKPTGGLGYLGMKILATSTFKESPKDEEKHQQDDAKTNSASNPKVAPQS